MTKADVQRLAAAFPEVKGIVMGPDAFTRFEHSLPFPDRIVVYVPPSEGSIEVLCKEMVGSYHVRPISTH